MQGGSILIRISQEKKESEADKLGSAIKSDMDRGIQSNWSLTNRKKFLVAVWSKLRITVGCAKREGILGKERSKTVE